MAEPRAIIIAAEPSEQRQQCADKLRRAGRRIAEVDTAAMLLRLLTRAQHLRQPMPTIVLATNLADICSFEIIQQCNSNGWILPLLVVNCDGQLSDSDRALLVENVMLLGLDDLNRIGIVEAVVQVEAKFRDVHAQKQQWLQQSRAHSTSIATIREQYHSRLMQQLQEFDFDPGAAPGAFAVPNLPPYLQYRRHSHGQAKDLLLVHTSGHKLTMMITDIGCATIEGVYRAMLTRTFFEQNMFHGREPRQFLNALHAQFRLEPQLDPPLVCLVLELDLQQSMLNIITAGFPGVTLLRQQSPVPLPMIAPGFPPGWNDQPIFGQRSEMLEPGDRILVFTDGITNRQRFDAQHLTVQRLSECRLDEMVQCLRPLSLDEMLSGLWCQIQQFTSTPLVENMLLVGLEIPGGAAVEQVN